MKTRVRARAAMLAVGGALSGAWSGAWSGAVWGQARVAPGCVRAVVEGEVRAGERFEHALTPGLEFLLEPMASGWMVRVLDARGARGAHDFAEIATPPYRSVTPLAVSTDFSFRAQDAVAWNPRRFRFAADAVVFRKMTAVYDAAMRGEPAAVGELARLAAEQPEAQLQILDSRIVAGSNDQAAMAAAVASHLAVTPHAVEPAAATPLGRVTWLKFRVSVDLPAGTMTAKGVTTAARSCK